MAPNLHLYPVLDKRETPTRMAYRKELHPTAQDRIDLLNQLPHWLRPKIPENLFELVEQGRPFSCLSAITAASIVPGDFEHDGTSTPEIRNSRLAAGPAALLLVHFHQQ